MTKRESLIGLKFSKLKVLYPADKIDKHLRWMCLCDCGNTAVVRASNLRTGRTKSCGCLVKETNTKHGGKGTRLYQIWINLKRRCTDPKAKDYKNYGERGIKYCQEWQEFNNFKTWADISGYSEDLTIDRVDVNGNYCPENCRWSDWYEQASNQRKSDNTSSKYLGVSFKNNRWQASVKRYGKNYYLGAFEEEIEAAKARDEFILNNRWPHKLNFKQE